MPCELCTDSLNTIILLIMTTIHFVGGEIGGAGKSTFCMLLLEAFSLYEIPYHFRDADRTTPNVGWAYDPTHYSKNSTPIATPKTSASEVVPGTPIVNAEAQRKRQSQGQATATQTSDSIEEWKPVIFSEDFDDFAKADTLIDLAGERDVIVNLPAQISNSFDKWLEAGDFLKCQDELGIKFVYWWVAKAEQRSLDLFYVNLQRFPSMPHILVCNQVRGVGEKWGSLLSKEQKEDLKRRGVTVMEMPELQLAPDERGILDRENPRFGDLVSHSNKRLGVASKLRCRKFIDTTLNNIVATGYLDGIDVPEEATIEDKDGQDTAAESQPEPVTA